MAFFRSLFELQVYKTSDTHEPYETTGAYGQFSYFSVFFVL